MAHPHQDVIKYTEEYMTEIMKRYDPSHDAYHVKRVRKTALALASVQAKPIDHFVVEMAALLHDVLDKKYVSAEEAADPYAFFTPFYRDIATKFGLDLLQDGRGKLIAQIIDNVSWTTESKRRTAGELSEWHDTCIELHCVQDADRLDAIGAFGIMRVSAYSAVVNRPLHVPADAVEDDVSAIGHFHEKLLHVHGRLKTAVGKELGQKRHIRLLDFLRSIEEEYDADLAHTTR